MRKVTVAGDYVAKTNSITEPRPYKLVINYPNDDHNVGKMRSNIRKNLITPLLKAHLQKEGRLENESFVRVRTMEIVDIEEVTGGKKNKKSDVISLKDVEKANKIELTQFVIHNELDCDISKVTVIQECRQIVLDAFENKRLANEEYERRLKRAKEVRKEEFADAKELKEANDVEAEEEEVVETDEPTPDDNGGMTT